LHRTVERAYSAASGLNGERSFRWKWKKGNMIMKQHGVAETQRFHSATAMSLSSSSSFCHKNAPADAALQQDQPQDDVGLCR